MLVLTRSVGDSIIIGDDIVVTVLEVNRGQVRIGIDAPLSVENDRSELRERKLASKLETAK
ncbi:MAG TPA: carbon storage regulator [Methylophaga sp.]|jgi:carbon storage regulator|uniref:carbon storage regulator n=1 Tax=unclassified Methylophaga TaxID=2629249 RepID=UPI000C97A764|nr:MULTISPECIES: carbon storage regulator [unclassified Methylophaga]MAP27746.1 carbon storage regulator [Methylophaga sp.]HAD32192.1 carbon storage regulator [Methylophaga sp.]HBX59861.1 carbon storage regulator [Methylophaga sp.]|tara:strand:+ start:3488 stop:3670 length:183 start_codon:yes stop_codon:yes gene_type:complete